MTSLKKSFAWSLLEQSGTKFVSLVVQVVLARLISPESFGILAILLVVTSIADAISQSGLGRFILDRFLAKRRSGGCALHSDMVLSATHFVFLCDTGDRRVPSSALYRGRLQFVQFDTALSATERYAFQDPFQGELHSRHRLGHHRDRVCIGLLGHMGPCCSGCHSRHHRLRADVRILAVGSALGIQGR